jgi:hypothetical protein
MSRLKRIMSLILLALWASCVIRCEAAKLTSSAALSCCDESSDDCGDKPAPPGHCVCSLAQSGGYISESSVVALPLPVVILVLTHPADLEVPLSSARPAELIFSPPELLAGWQFTHRAAAPPRAPSFVS